MKKSAFAYLHISLLTAALVVFSGCDWLGKSSHCGSCSSSYGGDSLITFDGKTVASTGELEQQLNMLFKSRPGVKEMVEQMPVEQQQQIYRQIADSIADSKLIKKFVEEKGLDRRAEFKENLRIAHEALETQLMLQAFQEHIFNEIKLDASDEKVHKYYEEYCTKLPIFKQPPFLVNAAGIKAQIVEFAQAREAQDFATKARSQGFDKAVSAEKKTARPVVINERAYDVDEAVRTKAADAKSIPAVVVVAQKNGKHAVVQLIKRQEDEFAPCEKVKDQVQQIMSQERFMQAYKEELAKLKERYNVSVHDEVLGRYIKQPVGAPAAANAESPSVAEAA